MKWLRIIIIATICTFIMSTMDSCRHKGGAYNPYLHMKTKPSRQQLKQDAKVVKKGRRAYKDQLGDSRKRIFGRRKPPKE